MNRVATPTRWARAFERAADSGIAPKQVAADTYAVKSAHGNVFYMVQPGPYGLTCSCKAAIEGDPICWHRAAAMRAAVAQAAQTGKDAA